MREQVKEEKWSELFCFLLCLFSHVRSTEDISSSGYSSADGPITRQGSLTRVNPVTRPRIKAKRNEVSRRTYFRIFTLIYFYQFLFISRWLVSKII